MEASAIYNMEKYEGKDYIKKGGKYQRCHDNIQIHLLNEGEADSGQKRAIFTKNNCVMISSIG